MIRRMKKGDMVQPSNLEKDNYQIKEDVKLRIALAEM